MSVTLQVNNKPLFDAMNAIDAELANINADCVTVMSNNPKYPDSTILKIACIDLKKEAAALAKMVEVGSAGDSRWEPEELEIISRNMRHVTISHLPHHNDKIGNHMPIAFVTKIPTMVGDKYESRTRHYYETAAPLSSHTYSATYRDSRMLAHDVVAFITTGVLPA